MAKPKSQTAAAKTAVSTPMANEQKIEFTKNDSDRLWEFACAVDGWKHIMKSSSEELLQEAGEAIGPTTTLLWHFASEIRSRFPEDEEAI